MRQNGGPVRRDVRSHDIVVDVKAAYVCHGTRRNYNGTVGEHTHTSDGLNKGKWSPSRHADQFCRARKNTTRVAENRHGCVDAHGGATCSGGAADIKEENLLHVRVDVGNEEGARGLVKRNWPRNTKSSDGGDATVVWMSSNYC